MVSALTGFWIGLNIASLGLIIYKIMQFDVQKVVSFNYMEIAYLVVSFVVPCLVVVIFSISRAIIWVLEKITNTSIYKKLSGEAITFTNKDSK